MLGGSSNCVFTMKVTMKSKGELEAEISSAIIRFKKEYMGRGPLSVKTYLLDDMVLVRLQGVLTAAEQKLVQVEDRSRGRDLIKNTRLELIEHGRPLLEQVIRDILSVDVVSLHTDISTSTGESILLFTLSAKPSFFAG
jgi:uncharacterized protein YbcI